jgi:magnesium-transporting ATPase (P-type)
MIHHDFFPLHCRLMHPFRSQLFSFSHCRTKQGMDFMSIDAESSELERLVTIGMSVCHTLHQSNNSSTGELGLIGNHVEICAFRQSGATLSHARGSSLISLKGQNYTVLQRYEFDTHRVTQSVVVENADESKTVFVKGSPEAIRALCDEGVPANFDESVHKASRSGVYQLAMAYKDIDDGEDEDLSRDAVEKNLRFGGFLSFRNVLRDNTSSVIREIKGGNVTVTMITGDNVLTGICIALEAGLIHEGRMVSLGRKTPDGDIAWTDADSELAVARPSVQSLNSEDNLMDLAVTGEAWSSLLQDDPKYAASIAPHIRVFGRCNPSDKVSVVSHFVQQGKKTLMCGDGGNDCGSLKSAHVGIALSASEASVVAPFTSLDKDIASVSEVLREGRCALASAFAAYSYYLIWGQVESYMQVINAYFAITFTDWCWVFLGTAHNRPRLRPRRTSTLILPMTMPISF